MNPEPTPQAPPNPALPLSPHSSILSTDRTDRWCAQQIADTGIWLGSVKAAPYSPSSGKPNEAKAEVLREKGIGFIINCGVVPTKVRGRGIEGIEGRKNFAVFVTPLFRHRSTILPNSSSQISSLPL